MSEDRTPAPGGDGSSTPPPARAEVSLPRWPPRLILLDEDPVRRASLSEGLGTRGWRILEALDARQALRMLEFGGSRYRPEALLAERTAALCHRAPLLDAIRHRPETAGMAVFLFQADIPGDLEETLERLEVWLRCLSEAHQEYSAGRPPQSNLL